ncbi:MAG: hypothetical protein WA162_05525 [Thermodesulfobacteriota bacterium]
MVGLGALRCFPVFVFLLFIVCGCGTVDDARVIDVKTDYFSSRIESLAAALRKEPGNAGLHYKLSGLYSHRNNPSKDYHKALYEIKKYIAAEDKGKVADYVLEKEGMLQAIVDCDNESKKLKEVIEQLKALDVRMEQERKLKK